MLEPEPMNLGTAARQVKMGDALQVEFMNTEIRVKS